MSDLPSGLLNDFSNMVIGEEPKEKQNTIYGTIVEKDETFYVKIDGSEELTPVNASVEIEDGDRVLLRLEGREATAIGNITAPASARTATNFMKLTDNGLMVGALDKDGKPSGSYTLMKPGGFQILVEDENGNNRVLAEFTPTAVNFGNKASFSENGVTLRNGAGKVLATFTASGINFNGRASFDDTGVKLYDNNGRLKASFIEDGVYLYDKDGARVAKFESGTIELGQTGSTIILGKKSNGQASLTIKGEAISSGEESMSISSRKNIVIEARKNDSTYIQISMVTDSQDPSFEILAMNRSKILVDLKMTTNGLVIMDSHDQYPDPDAEVRMTYNGLGISSVQYVNNAVDSLEKRIKKVIETYHPGAFGN